MALTEEQRVTLAAHIQANTDPDVVAALAIRNDTEITRLYNLDSSFWVWRRNVPVTDIEQNGFAWSSIDEVPDTKWRIWERLTAYGTIDFSKPNVRQGLIDFSKDVNGVAITALRDSIIPYTKRLATVAESVYATGTGTESVPGDLDFEGQITTTDVGFALNENP